MVAGERSSASPLAVSEELVSEIGLAGSSRLLKLIVAGALLAAVSLAVWIGGHSEMSWSPEVLAERIAGYGILSRGVFVAMMIIRPFMLTPFWVMVAVGGALFGAKQGILLATLGATLHGAFFFVAARVLGRDMVARHVSGRVAVVIDVLGERGPRYLAALLPIPGMPLSATFAAAGLSSMRFAYFLVAIVIGLFPRTVLYGFGGESFAEGHWTRLGFVAVAALVVAAFAVRYRGKLFSARQSS